MTGMELMLAERGGPKVSPELPYTLSAIGPSGNLLWVIYRIQNFPANRRLTTVSRSIHLNSTEILSIHIMASSSHCRDIRRRERRLKPWHGTLARMRDITTLRQLRLEVFRELRETLVFITAKGGRRVGLWYCDLGRGFAYRRVRISVHWETMLCRPMTKTAPTSSSAIILSFLGS